MDDTQLVAVDESIKHGCDNITGLCLRESLLLKDLIKELTALHKLHD